MGQEVLSKRKEIIVSGKSPSRREKSKRSYHANYFIDADQKIPDGLHFWGGLKLQLG